MLDPIDMLCFASTGGAFVGAATYVYAYVLQPRGDRRLHTASLFFSGLALANLPTILRAGPDGPNPLNSAFLVTFVLLAMGCQIPIAFRRRRTDRRQGDRRAAAPTAEPGAAV